MSIRTTGRTFVVYPENGHYTALSFCAFRRSFPVCHVCHYENMSLGLTPWCVVSHMCWYLIEVTLHCCVITRNPSPPRGQFNAITAVMQNVHELPQGRPQTLQTRSKATDRKVIKQSEVVRLNSHVGQKLCWKKYGPKLN